jgi:ABC-type transporter Mla subunit MlaD
MAAAVAGVLTLEHAHLRPGTTICVELARIGPLKEGAKLRMSGLVLGRVDAIRLEAEGKVILDVWVDDRYVEFIRENADLFIAREGMFGEAFLALAGTHGEPGAPIQEGTLIRGDDPPPMERLIVDAQRNYDELKVLFHDIGPDWSAFRASLDETAAQVEELDSPLPQVRQFMDEVRALDVPDLGPLTGARDAVGRMQTELATLAPRLRSAAALADRLGGAFGDERFRRLGVALDGMSESVSRVEHILAVANELAAWVQSGRGSVGALAADTEISDEFRQTRRRLFREPWRLLEVNRKRPGPLPSDTKR